MLRKGTRTLPYIAANFEVTPMPDLSAAHRLEAALKPTYSQIFEDLRGRKQRSGSGYSLPFVPMAGPEYDQAPRQVLVVGKVASVTQTENARKHLLDDFFAAGDDDGLFNALGQYWRRNIYQLVADAYEGKVANQYSARKLRTPWWSGVHRLVGPLVGATRPRDTFSRIAWSNVLKVGGRAGNPDPALIRAQQPHVALLSKEIAVLKPEIMVFATGWRFDNHLRAALPGVKVNSEAHLSRVTLRDFPRAYRSRHFQGFSYNAIDRFRQLIIRLPQGAGCNASDTLSSDNHR